MNKTLLTTLTLMQACLVLSACSNKDSYDSYQKDIFACDKQPVQHRESCQNQIKNTPSYEEYEKQRSQVLKK